MEYESEHIDRHDSRKRQSKLLDIHDMSVSYRGSMVQMDTSLSNASCNAVTDVSLSVRAGDILGIVGESGAGKSTLLHALIRLLPQSADITGNALFEGHDLLSLNEAELDRVRGDRIAMIFQNPGRMFDPSMRIGAQVTEVVCMHRGCTKREGKKVSIDLLKRMGLHDPEHIAQSYAFQLSGGMQQRVAIAMAMAFEPSLLLADEPTSALDTTTQLKVVNELLSLNRDYGTALILVTHNIALAYHVCTSIAVMDKGRVIEYGSAAEVIKNPQQVQTKTLIAAVPKVTA